jgi:hypothetical protein
MTVTKQVEQQEMAIEIARTGTRKQPTESQVVPMQTRWQLLHWTQHWKVEKEPKRPVPMLRRQLLPSKPSRLESMTVMRSDGNPFVPDGTGGAVFATADFRATMPNACLPEVEQTNYFPEAVSIPGTSTEEQCCVRVLGHSAEQQPS